MEKEESTCPPTPPSLPIDGSPKSSRWDDTPEKKDTEKSASPSGSRPSSPENCAICLGALTNKSFTNSCLHTFCFVCLLEWSKVKPECPLCKVGFQSIIHNVRSEEDYDQYHVKQRTEPPPYEAFPRSFRYRTTVSYGELTDWVARQQRLPRIGSSVSVQDAIPTRFLPHHPHHRRPQSTATSDFRRSIYSLDLWARLQPDVTGRYRECSPEFYRQNPAALHRIIPFLNRELNVLLNGGARVAYVMECILDLLPRFSMTSIEFRSRISNLIGSAHVAHFCHELRAYASSPYDVVGYDRAVEYRAQNPTDLSVDSVEHYHAPQNAANLSVEEVDHPTFYRVLAAAAASTSTAAATASPSSPQPGPSGISGGFASSDQENAVLSATVVSISSSSSESDSEDIQIVGFVKPRHVSISSSRSSSSTENDNEDVQIVGYVKPRHERTPEIITLSSPEHRSDTTPPQADQSDSMSQSLGAASLNTDDGDLVCINLGSNASTSMRWEESLFENLSSDGEFKPEFKYTPHRKSRDKSPRVKGNPQKHCRSQASGRNAGSSDISALSSSSSTSASSVIGARHLVKRNGRHMKNRRTRLSHSSSSSESDAEVPSTSRSRSRVRMKQNSSQRLGNKEDTSDPKSTKSSSNAKLSNPYHRSKSQSGDEYSPSTSKEISHRRNEREPSHHVRQLSKSSDHRREHSNSPSHSLKGSVCSKSTNQSPKLCSIVMTRTTSGEGEVSWTVDRARHERLSPPYKTQAHRRNGSINDRDTSWSPHVHSLVAGPSSSSSSQDSQDQKGRSREGSGSSSRYRHSRDESSSNSHHKKKKKRRKKSTKDDKIKKKKKKRSKSKDSVSPCREKKRRKNLPLNYDDSDS